jgi:glycosyltransferase involved in cell wall biosynthesis
MKTRVSVVIPTFNRAHCLTRALNSVLTQTYPASEIIVVDDGSSDSTHQLVADIAGQSSLPIHYLALAENLGVSKARNCGIQAAQNPWIAFLDSDDEWLPKKLESQLLLQEQAPQLKVIHGEEIWIRNGRRVNAMTKHQKTGGHIFSKCLPLCVISPSAVLIHRDVFDEVGLFKEDFTVCEDYDLWLRISSLYEIGFCSEAIITKYGGHTDQLSQQYIAMDYWRVKAISSVLSSRPRLNDEDRQLAQETLIKKSQILLRGYIKHNNLDHYDEIKDLMTQFMSCQT